MKKNALPGDGMKRFRGILVLTFAAFALSLVSGCSSYAAYKKCGFGGCPGDREMAAQVQARFDRHAALSPPNLISIRAVDRVVYLNGWVNTDFERQMAESVAAEAPGVVRVVNSIGLNNGR